MLLSQNEYINSYATTQPNHNFGDVMQFFQSQFKKKSKSQNQIGVEHYRNNTYYMDNLHFISLLDNALN